MYKVGIRCLQDHTFEEATKQFGGALKNRPDSISVERVQKLQLIHACTMYEVGKEHREAGDWDVAREFFRAAKKTRQALPSELQDKNEWYMVPGGV